MTIEELLNSRRIHKEEISSEDIPALLFKANEDLETAKKILSESIAWSYAIAYNGVLQASRAFVFSKGYRPASREGHKNTFLFLKASLGKELQSTVSYFDRVRVKRNENVYAGSVNITQTEVETLLEKAEEFFQVLEKLCRK